MPSPNSSRADIVQELNRRVRGIEQGRVSAAPEQGVVSTGIAPLDQLLPDAGLRWGSLTEWLNEEGGGAMMLALLSLKPLLKHGGALVIIDAGSEFYPPAASGLGIDLNQTVLVRPARTADILWTWEQALQCSGVAAVLGWIEPLSDRAGRRLQLAVERGGGIGFLIRPVRVRGQPSWAELRLCIQPLPSTNSSSGRRLRLELLHCRGGLSGGAVELEISHETGLVHLAAGLASATPRARQARA
jgi:protein ImuA